MVGIRGKIRLLVSLRSYSAVEASVFSMTFYVFHLLGGPVEGIIVQALDTGREVYLGKCREMFDLI